MLKESESLIEPLLLVDIETVKAHTPRTVWRRYSALKLSLIRQTQELTGISVYFLVDSHGRNKVMCHPPSC